METFWITQVVTVAVGPMLYATFSRNKAARSPMHRGFSFVWPLFVLFGAPLTVTPGQVAKELFVVAGLVVAIWAVCVAVVLTRRDRDR